MKMVNGKLVPLTQAEKDKRAVEEAAEAIKAEEYKRAEYQRLREQTYPKIGDQFDRIFKFLKANREVLSLLGFDMLEVDGYIADIQNIKDKHPKPEK